MVKSFAHKGLALFFASGKSSGIQSIHAKRLRLILAQIDKAATIADLDIPSLRLHELKGRRKGIWSVTVQANWRVTFCLENGEAHAVDYEDYH